jgi:hypothetical protein
MTPFKGQTENAGHFLQPTARAIGHNVIWFLPFSVLGCGRSYAGLILPVVVAIRTRFPGRQNSRNTVDFRHVSCSNELTRLRGMIG